MMKRIKVSQIKAGNTIALYCDKDRDNLIATVVEVLPRFPKSDKIGIKVKFENQFVVKLISLCETDYVGILRDTET